MLRRAYIKTILLSLLLLTTANARTEWRYSRVGETESTVTLSYRGDKVFVSARQFCFAMGCELVYQWGAHRATIRNPSNKLTALVSVASGVAILDGRVFELKRAIEVDGKEGYLFPVEFAAQLAEWLRLGRLREIEIRDGAPVVKPKKSHLKKLVIDPGHGGSDHGTSAGSITEKDVSLIYALRLKEKIESEIPEMEVFLTRDSDDYVSLPDRAKFANAKEADLFVSLHLNHALNPKVEGVESYILSMDATDSEAKKLALMENESWLRSSQLNMKKGDAGAAIKKILVDMEQTKYIQSSALAASIFQQEMSSLGRTHGLKSRGVKQAMFHVLSQVAMPSVLVEMGFLSSSGDRGRLMDYKYRDEFVAKLVAAVRRYRDKQK